MDVKFINPVLESLVNVLTTMANMPSQVEKPSIKSNSTALGVATGLIDLKGKQATGSVAISFTKPVALEIAKRMLQHEGDEIDEMVLDLIGEMANMVAGGAKAKLQEQGYDFEMSLPKILSGDSHTIDHSVSGSTVLLPFSSEAGKFYIEICFEQ